MLVSTVRSPWIWNPADPGMNPLNVGVTLRNCLVTLSPSLWCARVLHSLPDCDLTGNAFLGLPGVMELHSDVLY